MLTPRPHAWDVDLCPDVPYTSGSNRHCPIANPSSVEHSNVESELGSSTVGDLPQSAGRSGHPHVRLVCLLQRLSFCRNYDLIELDQPVASFS